VLTFSLHRCRYCGAPDRVEAGRHSLSAPLLICLDCVRALLRRDR
jgi:hypothetical protein